ncbi:hypothetical protein RhiLY_01288 [Ceratobasidium sp. AG-Ba]|nr:hypothetical protein RhiLY_01288 [Ceratobasidium sp. AG-Ba]
MAPVPLEPLDSTSDFPRAQRKQDFAGLKHLSSACRWLHELVRQHWFTILYIRVQEDWVTAKSFDVCQYVRSVTVLSVSLFASSNSLTVSREIRVCSGALTGDTPSTAFLDYLNLHTAFVDVHHDFVPNNQAPSSHFRSTTLGRYQILTSNMPRSLRRLWVVNAHGPDASLIRGLCRSCPELEELSISRCTLFSPRLRNHPKQPGVDTCRYWELFPGDDSYFGADGIEEYAVCSTSLLAEDGKPN